MRLSIKFTIGLLLLFLVANYTPVFASTIDDKNMNHENEHQKESTTLRHYISEGTWITMNDNRKRKIEVLRRGDRIKTYNIATKQFGEHTIQAVTKSVQTRMIRVKLENKIQIVTTNNYPYMSDNGWRTLNPEQQEDEKYQGMYDFIIDDYLMFYNDTAILSQSPIVAIEGLHQVVIAYAIVLDGGDAYIANGFVMGQ